MLSDITPAPPNGNIHPDAGSGLAITVGESKDGRFVVIAVMTPICMVNIPMNKSMSESIGNAILITSANLGKRVIDPSSDNLIVPHKFLD
jgi:hypothetical protein